MSLSGNDLICLQKSTGQRRRPSRANELARLGTPDLVKDWNMEEILALRAFLCLSCLPDSHQGCGLVQHSGDEDVNHQKDDPAIGRTAN